MRTYRMLALALAACTGGCGVFFTFDFGGRESGASELKRFASEDELTSYLRTQIRRQNQRIASFERIGITGGLAAPEAVADAPASDADGGSGDAAGPTPAPGDFSQTTIQEAGVDEADVVKTDGTFLYMIVAGGEGSILRIVRAFPPEQLAVVSETPLEGFGQDIYLDGDTVVALTSRGGVIAVPFGIEPVTVAADGPASQSVDGGGADAAPEIAFQRPRTIVTVVDVTDRDAPTVRSTTRFDGTNASSRLIDGVLHLVLANYPSYFGDVVPLTGASEPDVDQIEADDVVPTFSRVDAAGAEVSGDAVTWQELYYPTDPDGFGMVYVVSIDIDNQAEFTTVGVVAQPGLIYSSRQALYLTDFLYDFSATQRQTTDIYKFAYQERGAQPVATGTVPGRVLNQYSMDEDEGFLRVATTIDRMSRPFGIISDTSNNVYVLNTADGALAVVGSIENLAPGETIRSARFSGKRGYLVTFEQIDPLFTLDLSDPANPQVMGELKMPGFSTFLVPMDESHLLAVGQYIPAPPQFGPSGVQLSIFDVSDFSNPTLQDNVVIGADTGASSEATSNPKAFTYFAEAGLVAVPIDIFDGPIFFEDARFDLDADDVGTDFVEGPIEAPAPQEVPGFNGLLVFSATVDGGLEELGRISTRFEDRGIFGSTFTRGLFIEDSATDALSVYAATNFGIRAAPLGSLQTPAAELAFDSN